MTIELKLKQIVEAALLAAGGPMTLDLLQEIFLEDERPDKPALRAVIQELQHDYRAGHWLVEVAGGYRINVRAELAPGFPDYGRNGRCVIPGLCWKHWL